MIPNAKPGGKRFSQKARRVCARRRWGNSGGWGIHFDDEARIAIYARGTEAYDQLKDDPSLKH
ncbi:MAG: DUF6157 family protein [Kouleothrix sp.]